MVRQNLSEKYQAVHMRVRRVLGKASDHECVECGAQAYDHAYNGLDPDAVCDLSQRGKGLVTYSPDPAFYEPLCRSCHQIKDQAQLRLNALARAAGEALVAA